MARATQRDITAFQNQVENRMAQLAAQMREQFESQNRQLEVRESKIKELELAAESCKRRIVDLERQRRGANETTAAL